MLGPSDTLLDPHMPYDPYALASNGRYFCNYQNHGRTTRGGHGLPKVSLGPAMPDSSTPCERATPETACGHLLTLWTPHAVRLGSER
jgi:hypothetical protein